MNGLYSINSVVSESELSKMEAEIDRLEALSEKTSLTLSDVRSLIQEIKQLKKQQEITTAMLVRVHDVVQQAYDTIQHSSDDRVNEAQAMLECILWHDNIKKIHHHYERIQSVLIRAAEKLEAGQAITSEDEIGLEVRRASQAVSRHNDIES